MDDVAALARIDSFPYQHRLSEVMSKPVLTASPHTSVMDAVRLMSEQRASSLVAVSETGRTLGIFTERDLLKLISNSGPNALNQQLGDVMTSPVATVDCDDFVYVALAKMSRFGFRHLVVVDKSNRPLGMITGRTLLRVRANDALPMSNLVEEAMDASDMRRALDMLPSLARGLLSEGVSARMIASVVAGMVRNMTRRATELAEIAMAQDGWGPAPVPYAMLVLGSGGRGESLLVFDQDNAIVYNGGAEHDAWFAELGRRVNETLHDAGIPYCDGGVMAREPKWRKSLDEWQKEIHGWVFALENQTVMYCDIFFDFQPVWGDEALAEDLRSYAIEKASQSAFFQQYLAQHVAGMEVSLGFFGEFVTSQGRLNAKKFGLLPLVSAARFRAIRAGIALTGTDERYTALKEGGHLHEDDWRDFLEIREVVTRLMLDQQLLDLENNIPPSAKVDPKRLLDRDKQKLRWAFKRLKTLKFICGVTG